MAGPELELVRARRSVAFFETKADRLYQLYKEERILADVWRSRAAAAEDKLNQLDRQLAVEEVMEEMRLARLRLLGLSKSGSCKERSQVGLTSGEVEPPVCAGHWMWSGRRQ